MIRITLTLFILFYALFAIARTSAIIEDSRIVYSISSKQHLVVTQYNKIKILDEDGYRFAVFTDYYDAFKKVKTLRATIYDVNGNRVKKMSQSDGYSVMFNASYEINDARTIILDPQYRNFPFTIEIETESVYTGFLSFPPWIPRHSPGLEVKKATLIFRYPTMFKFNSMEVNGVPAGIKKFDGVSDATFWEVSNLEAQTKQVNERTFVKQQPSVHIAPLEFELNGTTGKFESWATFGDWFWQLNKGRNAISDETKKFLDGLKSTYGNDAATTAKIVYQHMQKKTRYISIQLGIGGFQTIPSDQVEKSGYGDCKALTNYMKSMLDYIGIKSNYVLVNAGEDQSDILNDFPSNQFNHVFLAIPQKEDTLWFECTSQLNPPGYIGTFTDDRYVLWINENINSKVVRTPVYSATENTIKRTCTVTVDETGNAAMEMKITESGIFFSDFMNYTYLPKDYIERFNYKRFPYKDYTIKEFNFNQPDANRALLNVDFKLNINNLGKQLGGKLALPHNLLTSIEDHLELDLINGICEVRRAFTVEDHVKIKIPENFRLGSTPEPVIIDTKFGSYEISAYSNEDSMTVRRKVIVNKGFYEKQSFTEFNDVIKKIKQSDQQKLVLINKT